jgi:transcriptional regulator with XRE-family HTH domain
LGSVLKEFKDRFAKACLDNPDIPPFNRGQQTFLAQNLGVSQEAVRKWFYGESKPKSPTARKLAKLLKVDYLWLMMGTEHGEIEIKKVAAQRQDSAVYAFMAFMLEQGYSAAFEQSDSDTDVVSIRGGEQNQFTVRAVESAEEHMFVRFPSSSLSLSTSIVAVKTQSSSLSFDFLIVKPEMWQSESKKKGSMSVLKITNPSKRKYLVGDTKIPFYLE